MIRVCALVASLLLVTACVPTNGGGPTVYREDASTYREDGSAYGYDGSAYRDGPPVYPRRGSDGAVRGGYGSECARLATLANDRRLAGALRADYADQYRANDCRV